MRNALGACAGRGGERTLISAPAAPKRMRRKKLDQSYSYSACSYTGTKPGEGAGLLTAPFGR